MVAMIGICRETKNECLSTSGCGKKEEREIVGLISEMINHSICGALRESKVIAVQNDLGEINTLLMHHDTESIQMEGNYLCY